MGRRSSPSCVQQIGGCAPLGDAALLESGEGSICSRAIDGSAGEAWFTVGRDAHGGGIVGDVGRKVQRSADAQPVGERSDGVGSDHSTVVLARPPVGATALTKPTVWLARPLVVATALANTTVVTAVGGLWPAAS